MATPNRAALITKLHKVLKKHYEPVEPLLERPVLEQLLFACCLENSHYKPAEAAYAALASSFFDWNEVRVSTINELGEAVKMLPDPPTSAARLRRILQSVFETTYSFDLEGLKKLNLGPAVQKLEKMAGTSAFVAAYATQTALGGHSIPLDRGTLEALAVIGLASPADLASGVVPGLERAIPKNKGFEFASLLHQLGADMTANPLSPSLHKLLLEIAPDCKDRLPKKVVKKPEPPPVAMKPKQVAKEAPKDKADKPAQEVPKKKPPESKDKPETKAKPAVKTPEKKKSPSMEKKSSASTAKKSSAGLSKRKPR